MKRFIIILLAVFTALSAAAGPKDAMKHIKFGKCRIVSLVPTGLRSVRAGVELETKNDTLAFQLQDVKLMIYRKGEPFVEGVCDEISVPKGPSKVRVTGDFELCDDVSVWSAATALRNADLSEFTGDVDLTVVNAKGRKVAYSQKDVSMGSITGQKKTEKKADTQVATADTGSKSSATTTSAKPSTQKAEQPKPTKKTKKRPWWQFWKK